MRHDFAPMEGVTGYVYRNLHRRHFGGVDRYYMPFVSANQSFAFARKEWQDILPDNNGFDDLVPQILSKDADAFLWAVKELRSLGYREINLNLGCPSGTVASKGRGAGFLGHPEELDAFLSEVFSRVEGPISVKTRLGVEDPAEFPALLEIYSRYPISELIIHPRVRKDFYKHPARVEDFAAAVEQYPGPLCYNGDLMSLSDCRRMEERFPHLRGLMLGRGLIANPAMLVPEKQTKERLEAFHEELFETYSEMFGSGRNAMMRMKEIWFYHIHLFEDHEKLFKRLRRTTDVAEYRAAVREIYQHLTLRPDAVQGW